MHFAISGNATFVPTEGTATARVRLFLQQRGDTLTAQEPYKRWWSLPHFELREGEFTLTVPLSPDQWTSVFGQGGAEVPNEFNVAISKLGNVGFYVRGHVRWPWGFCDGWERPLCFERIFNFPMRTSPGLIQDLAANSLARIT